MTRTSLTLRNAKHLEQLLDAAEKALHLLQEFPLYGHALGPRFPAWWLVRRAEVIHHLAKVLGLPEVREER